MKALICPCCNGTEFEIIHGYRVCSYCGTKFYLERRDILANSAGISIKDDIGNLLQKCKTDPHNMDKYVNLILDIDPDNEQALRLLKRIKNKRK